MKKPVKKKATKRRDRRGETPAPTKHYLLIMHNDIEPDLLGPFNSVGERDTKAKQLRKIDTMQRHGLFMVEARGYVRIDAYSGGFFEEE